MIKIIAIICLTVLEVVNILTTNYDGGLLIAISSLIAGLAGYEIGKGKRTDEADM